MSSLLHCYHAWDEDTNWRVQSLMVLSRQSEATDNKRFLIHLKKPDAGFFLTFCVSVHP